MADRNTCVCGDHQLNSGCPILKRAVKELGEGARIGRNFQYSDSPLFVGTYTRGDWKSFGAGKTWDEAFASVKKVVFQRGNGRFVYEGEDKK